MRCVVLFLAIYGAMTLARPRAVPLEPVFVVYERNAFNI